MNNTTQDFHNSYLFFQIRKYIIVVMEKNYMIFQIKNLSLNWLGKFHTFMMNTNIFLNNVRSKINIALFPTLLF